jgi:hypothetical protein
MDRAHITDALRFWELARIPYNLVLLTIVVLVVGPQFGAMPVNALGLFVFLAVLANVLYSVVYPIDIFMQMSAWHEGWRAARFGLWLIGMLTAAWLTFNVSLALAGID